MVDSRPVMYNGSKEEKRRNKKKRKRYVAKVYGKKEATEEKKGTRKDRENRPTEEKSRRLRVENWAVGGYAARLTPIHQLLGQLGVTHDKDSLSIHLLVQPQRQRNHVRTTVFLRVPHDCIAIESIHPVNQRLTKGLFGR